MPSVSKRRKPIGRPSKKTPELVNELLKLIATGAPYSICAASVGLHPDTLMDWKREDSEFATQVEKAAAKSALRLLGKIEKHGEDNFQSLAWILERRFPETFSRPEVQLNLIQQINNSQTVNQTLVVTAEMATQIQSRVERVDATIEKLFRARTAAQMSPATRTNGDDIREVETSLVLGMIVMPVGIPSAAWWGQLVRGDNMREVERATAIKIVRQILTDVFGQLRSQNTPVEFAPGAPILLRDVHARLESLCGACGWAALTKRAAV
jgi:hypothetical protein